MLLLIYAIEVYTLKFKSHILLALFFSIVFLITSGFTVVGHRGDPTKYPEETIQSDNSAFRAGADYVELDLRLSKDGVPIISHDDDLFRVTHTHAIVSQNNFAALSKLRYDNGEHVLSLGELFKYYRNKPNTKFVLETKIDHSLDHSYALEEKIAHTIKKYHMEKRVMIHSFSDASLFRMRQLLPHAYLIQIVGSLKRINFSILPQVNAVNVSSDIVQEHPFLIHWLHHLHKQIYVWAEMNESPALWHWLINRNVDGVVTNFPATGFKYKLAKSGTKKYSIHRSGIYFGKSKTSIMMNPYVRIHQKHYVYPNQKLNVMYGVRVDNKLYYQIAAKTFISAQFVNLDLRPKDIAPYQNKQIFAKMDRKVRLYQAPDNEAKTNRYLPAGKLFNILNFNGSPKSMWLYTKLGWLKAKNIMFYGFFNKKNFRAYNSLPRISRYPNLALLNFPVQNESLQINNYYQLLKYTHAITK